MLGYVLDELFGDSASGHRAPSGHPERPAREEAVRTALLAAGIAERGKHVATRPATDEELARFKTRAKADLIRSLNSNAGLAEQLTAYHVLFGDWRELFRYVERMEAVTKADIRRVQEWMGHADVQTTMRYLHYAPHGDEAALVAEAFSLTRLDTAAENQPAP